MMSAKEKSPSLGKITPFDNVSLELEVRPGYACNNNCVFCVNRRCHYKSFPLEVITGQITDWSRRGCKNLVITGGDPLISPDFFKILNFAKENGFKRIEIQTNGRMLCYEEFVKKIMEVQPMRYEFFVSLHFSDKESHKKYTRADGFEQVIAGIKNLLKNNLSVSISTVVMKQNLDCLGDVTDLLRSMETRKLQLKQQFRQIDGYSVREHFKDFVPQMSTVARKIRKVIKDNCKDIRFVVNEIPLCILGKDMEGYMTTPTNPQRVNPMMESVVPSVRQGKFKLKSDFKIIALSQMMKNMFVFSDRCAVCSCRAACKGIRRDYSEVYGFSELRPIKGQRN